MQQWQTPHVATGRILRPGLVGHWQSPEASHIPRRTVAGHWGTQQRALVKRGSTDQTSGVRGPSPYHVGLKSQDVLMKMI